MKGKPGEVTERGISGTTLAVLGWFQHRADRGEAPPTLRDIAKHFGWASSAAARYHVNRLVVAGALAPARGRHRGARVKGVDSMPLPLVLHPVPGQADQDRVFNISVPKQILPDAPGAFLVQATHRCRDCLVDAGDLVVVDIGRKPGLRDEVVIQDGVAVRVDRAGRRRFGGKILGVVAGVLRSRVGSRSAL